MTLSAPLLSKKRVIKVVLETEKGTKVAGTQALFVDELSINPTAPFIERKGTGLYRGHEAAGVIGERSGKCSFTAEVRGTGAGGCEAGLAMLLQACGLAKTLEVYQVHSSHTIDKTLSIDVWIDGKKKGLAGASGTVVFEGTAGGRLLAKFDFDGNWQTPIDEALPAFAPSTLRPMQMQGGTFTVGGEALKIDKFNLDMGCTVVARKDVTAVGGIAYFMTSDVLPMLSLDPEADLVAGYDYFGIWVAGTEGAVSYIITNGTTKATFTIPKFQYRDISESDREGIFVYDANGQCNHSAGNDAVTITFAAA